MFMQNPNQINIFLKDFWSDLNALEMLLYLRNKAFRNGDVYTAM